MTLELDDDGTLRYEVRELRPRVRVGEHVGERKRVATPTQPTQPGATQTVHDAEFDDAAEEEARAAEKKKMRR